MISELESQKQAKRDLDKYKFFSDGKLSMS